MNCGKAHLKSHLPDHDISLKCFFPTALKDILDKVEIGGSHFTCLLGQVGLITYLSYIHVWLPRKNKGKFMKIKSNFVVLGVQCFAYEKKDVVSQEYHCHFK